MTTFTFTKTFNTWLRKQKIISGGDNVLILNVVFKAVISCYIWLNECFSLIVCLQGSSAS